MKVKVKKALALLDKVSVVIYSVDRWYGGPEEGGWYGTSVEMFEVYALDHTIEADLEDRGITQEYPARGGYFYRLEPRGKEGKEEYHTSHFWDA